MYEMYENIYGMVAIYSKALKGNVILTYHNQVYLIFCEYCHSKIKNRKLNLQSTKKIGIGVPAVRSFILNKN